MKAKHLDAWRTWGAKSLAVLKLAFGEKQLLASSVGITTTPILPTSFDSIEALFARVAEAMRSPVLYL